MLNTLEWIWNFLLLVMGFGLVIFVHELGHFLAAKAVGIKVEQFAIGFGNAALSWRRGLGLRPGSSQSEPRNREGWDKSGGGQVGETEYRLNWFPLGGYVKMLGQDDMNPAAQSDDPRSFSSKPVWARMVVISAGVVMNILFAILLFVIAYSVGVEVNPPVVGEVDPASYAAHAEPRNAEVELPGLHPGDRIVRVNDDPVRTFNDIAIATALARADRPVRIDVERDGRPLSFDIRPQPGPDELLKIGIAPSSDTRIVDVRSKSDREDFNETLELLGLGDTGIEPGMRLTHINGEPIDAFWQFAQAVDESESRPIEVTFDDGKDATPPLTITLSPIPEPLTAVIEVGGRNVPVQHQLGLVAPQKITRVKEGSGAEAAGLRKGDVIARVNGVAWPRFDQFIEVVQASQGDEVAITVERNGELMTVPTRVSRAGTVGIYTDSAWDEAVVAQALPAHVETANEKEDDGSDRAIVAGAAASLDLLPGARIVSIDGEPIDDYTDLILALRRNTNSQADAEAPATVELAVEMPIPNNPVATMEWELSRAAIEAIHRDAWQVNLNSGLFAPLMFELKADNPLHAAEFGFHETKRMLVTTYLTIDRLIRGSIQIDNLKGPVGIAELGTRVAYEGGILYLILFLAIINVNLAVINFLPIPVLDGGWFVLLAIEKIKGSPVSEQARNAATMVGFLFLAAIILITFYNDVANLIRGFMA